LFSEALNSDCRGEIVREMDRNGERERERERTGKRWTEMEREREREREVERGYGHVKTKNMKPPRESERDQRQTGRHRKRASEREKCGIETNLKLCKASGNLLSRLQFDITVPKE
jgi:hypothetical protein